VRLCDRARDQGRFNVTTFAPTREQEVIEAVRWATAAGEPLEVIGTGTRRGLGRPVSVPHVLDLSALSGIVSYEPAELVLTAWAGTPLAEITSALAEHRQHLAFEPLSDVEGTLGGVVATGLSGPRRPKAGAVRDHVLGIAAVSGRGESFVGGGKVVKNVTGYDIPKLMTGSYGTLAVFTEITLKVLPAPEDVRTLIIHGVAAREAVRLTTTVLQSAAEVSGACHVPASVVADGTSQTAYRFEGVGPSVEFRLARVRDALGGSGPVTVLERDESVSFWRSIRDVTPFAGAAERMVWRISVPPAEGASVLERLERAIPGAHALLDWGGGLIWFQLPEADESMARDARAAVVRAALTGTQGHATLVRAPASVRETAQVFQPQAAGLAALSKRVKAQFDPRRVLNPGRMYADV